MLKAKARYYFQAGSNSFDFKIIFIVYFLEMLLLFTLLPMHDEKVHIKWMDPIDPICATISG